MAIVRAMKVPNSFPDTQLEAAGLLGLTAGLPPAWLGRCSDRACVREKFCCHLPKSLRCSSGDSGRTDICVGAQASPQTKGNGMKGMEDEEAATAVVDWLLFITVQN